jgi:phenylalanyl-tRNA synthetase beta chain
VQAAEHHGLAVLIAGDLIRPGWRGEAAPADFFAAKGLLSAVLAVAGVEWELAPAQWPFLHPGRSAAVVSGEERIGFIGELHPLVAGAWDLERVAAWALDLGKLAGLAPELTAYAPFGEHPAVREDVAVVVDDTVGAGAVAALIEGVVHDAGDVALARAEIFDVYRGPQVGEGRVSLAFHLEFRAPDRTLTDEEIAVIRAKIADALGQRYGGSLRA